MPPIDAERIAKLKSLHPTRPHDFEMRQCPDAAPSPFFTPAVLAQLKAMDTGTTPGPSLLTAPTTCVWPASILTLVLLA